MLDILSEALSRFYPRRPDGPFAPATVAASVEAGATYLALAAGEPAGTITLHEGEEWGHGARALCVHRLAVRPSASGQGYGLAMLRWAQDQAAAGGKTVLRLDCLADQPGINAYYQRAGFAFIGAHHVANAAWQPVNRYQREVARA